MLYQWSMLMHIIIVAFYIVHHRIRQTKHTFHRFGSRQNNVKFQKYSKILPDLVILESITQKGG